MVGEEDDCSVFSILSFQMALCNESLVELANSGASGSLFYVTNDDEFIVKTVQHKEAEFLQKLLPGYYLVSVVYFIILILQSLSDVYKLFKHAMYYTWTVFSKFMLICILSLVGRYREGVGERGGGGNTVKVCMYCQRGF